MFSPIVKGKVWKFGDSISTDFMMPGFARGNTPMERALFCMRSNRPDFAKQVKPGDVIVGGKNFGCGSSRPAARNLIALGIGCAIAETFSRTFFRSAINLNFPVLYCEGISEAFNEGDILEANFITGQVKNLTSGKVLKAAPLPEIALNMLKAGGVVELLKKEYAGK